MNRGHLQSLDPDKPPSFVLQGNGSAVHCEVSQEDSRLRHVALLLDPSDPGVASCLAVVVEVIVRHPLGSGPAERARVTMGDSRSGPSPDVGLIPHRRRRQPMRSARDTMIPSGPRT